MTRLHPTISETCEGLDFFCPGDAKIFIINLWGENKLENKWKIRV